MNVISSHLHIVSMHARDLASYVFVLSDKAACIQVASNPFLEQKMIVNGSKERFIGIFNISASWTRLGEVDLIASR